MNYLNDETEQRNSTQEPRRLKKSSISFLSIEYELLQITNMSDFDRLHTWLLPLWIMPMGVSFFGSEDFLFSFWWW